MEFSVLHSRYLLVIYFIYSVYVGFPGGSLVKESAWNAGDMDLISGSRRSSGEGNGNPLQYSCLGNPMDEELEGYSPWGRKSQTRLGDSTTTSTSVYRAVCTCQSQTVLILIELLRCM